MLTAKTLKYAVESSPDLANVPQSATSTSASLNVPYKAQWTWLLDTDTVRRILRPLQDGSFVAGPQWFPLCRTPPCCY